jgi:hypothetical protein
VVRLHNLLGTAIDDWSASQLDRRTRSDEIDATFNWAWLLTNIEPFVVPFLLAGRRAFGSGRP